MPAKFNLVGQRFGRLTVLAEEPVRTPCGAVRWLCRCDCGYEKPVSSNLLRRGKARSCGCQPVGPRPKPIEYVVNEKGCHICTSHSPRKRTKDTIGYPTISIAGKDLSINRVLYERKYGAVPEHQLLRHTCDDPMCINPDHCIPGSHEDNMRDKVERGRTTKGRRYAAQA